MSDGMDEVQRRINEEMAKWKGNPDKIEIARLRALNAELVEALKGVVRVADRATVELDAARAAIAKAEREGT